MAQGYGASQSDSGALPLLTSHLILRSAFSPVLLCLWLSVLTISEATIVSTCSDTVYQIHKVVLHSHNQTCPLRGSDQNSCLASLYLKQPTTATKASHLEERKVGQWILKPGINILLEPSTLESTLEIDDNSQPNQRILRVQCESENFTSEKSESLHPRSMISRLKQEDGQSELIKDAISSQKCIKAVNPGINMDVFSRSDCSRTLNLEQPKTESAKNDDTRVVVDFRKSATIIPAMCFSFFILLCHILCILFYDKAMNALVVQL